MSWMNSTLKTTLLAACTAVAATTAVANSHDHTVYIYPDGFFPSRIYVNAGDTIQYVNKTGTGQQMVIPYSFNAYYNVPNTLSFWMNNNAVRDITVNPTRVLEVANPDGDWGENGFIVPGLAPRSGISQN